tara:strand:- start:7385 stop:7906 length:522 start_codon:yes stop_codon:yes gene_type:complete
LRKINKIIVHCSATREGHDVDAKTIREWHLRRGWKDIGYHYIVRLDGTIEPGRMINISGAHTKGYNSESIGICYIGGVEAEKVNNKWVAKDTRTQAQKDSLLILIKLLKLMYKDATIHGHREFANKACPSFDASEEYKNLKLKNNDGIYNNKLACIINCLYGIFKSYNKPNSN